MQLNPLVGLLDMFPGLHVGQVLGQGRFGSVYQGRWQSVNVAIKASGGRLTAIAVVMQGSRKIAVVMPMPYKVIVLPRPQSHHGHEGVFHRG